MCYSSDWEKSAAMQQAVKWGYGKTYRNGTTVYANSVSIQGKNEI